MYLSLKLPFLADDSGEGEERVVVDVCVGEWKHRDVFWEIESAIESYAMKPKMAAAFVENPMAIWWNLLSTAFTLQ